MYRIVNGYSEEKVELPNGQLLPESCLVEDEEGKIFLFSSTSTVQASNWGNAAIAGAEGLIRLSPQPSFLAKEVFDAEATLDLEQNTYTIPEYWWSLIMPETFTTELTEAIVEPESEPEQSSNPWVHLHTHSEFSALDGYSTMKEIVDKVVADGQTAVAITDHGLCTGYPELQATCEEQGIKPIFGLEAYFVDDRHSREDTGDYRHLILWATNEEGLRNLYAISSEGYRDGHHGHPRVDWDTLTRLNGGIIASTACLRGPVSYYFLQGRAATALSNLSKLKEIFDDRLYIEIHTNQLPEQKRVNKWLVEQARAFDIPLVGAVDSHYACEEDQHDHQVWLAMQTNHDISEETGLFGGGEAYHLMTLEEVMVNLAYLGADVAVECITNTSVIADKCNARIEARNTMPVYSVGEDAVAEDASRMLEMCIDAWEERTGGKGKEAEYLARFERESDLLIRKGFPGYFLMVADQVRYAKANGVLVGPGRGSGGGSLVAYLMGITEIDPVENDLLFERFMTEGRESLPDFDIDFPSSRKQFMLDYVKNRWGEQHVVTVGTHTRIQNKSAFKDSARAIKSQLPEGYFGLLDEISGIIAKAEAHTAGLGLSWDELFQVAGDLLEPYKQKLPEVFRLAGRFRNRLKAYSKHAAGVIIDPKLSLDGALPMKLGLDGVTMVTQWGMEHLEPLGFIKFDFLNLRNLDTIQECVDLIFSDLGERIDVTKWRDEYKDPQVFEDLSLGRTLGCFQIETSLGTRTTKLVKPKSIAELADVITLGRPGPMGSGLDKLYLKRRNGEEEVTLLDQRLLTLLEKSWGVMIYQEDIMATCMVLATYDSNEADEVRKILGKKKVEKVAAEGEKFIRRATENHTDLIVAQTIWEQMAEFARYSFNRAHAFAYATLSYWTAWLKHHYPLQFFTACLSTIENEDIPRFAAEARRLGYKVLPPDINISKKGFAGEGLEIRYGLESIKGVGEAASTAIMESQPYNSWDDFMERKGSKCNIGHIKALARIGAFDKLVSNRKALESRLSDDSSGESKKCIFWRMEQNEFDLPCGFDWNSEEPEIGRSGKKLKMKPPPKKCTTRCRQYVQRPALKDDEVEPYTDKEIMNIEMEHLGIYLSSSPFDIIPEEDREVLYSADDLEVAEAGSYLAAIMIMRVRDYEQSDGRMMKFLTAATPSGDMDITVFASSVDQYKQYLQVGQMALVEVKKNDRGQTLNLLQPI